MSSDLLPASRKVRLASWSSRWWESPTASPLRLRASGTPQPPRAAKASSPSARCARLRPSRATATRHPNSVHAAACGVQRLPRVTGPFGELLPYDHAAAEAQLLLGEAIAAAGSRARRLAAGRFCYHCACTGGRANERAGSRLLVLTTTHVVCLSRSVGNSAELEWAEPLSAIATAEVAAEEPRTDVRLVVHLRDGGMRFVEGDARLRRSFVTKLASAIRALAAQPGS